MNTNTAIPTTGVPEQKRNKAALKFFTAQIRLLEMTEIMVDNVYAITQDPAHRASLDAVLGQIEAKQVELSSLLDSFLPQRSPEQADYDRKFVKAGHAAENRVCNHAHYSFKEHGRFCTCGTIMCDPGD